MQNTPEKIIVTDEDEIFLFQEKFHQNFPYLKIEFFSVSANQGQLIEDKFTNKNKSKLGNYRIIGNVEKIIITSQTTVASLEEMFNKIYGLGTIVLRKSGKTWLETTITDVWTLEQQNFQGEALSKHI